MFRPLILDALHAQWLMRALHTHPSELIIYRGLGPWHRSKAHTVETLATTELRWRSRFFPPAYLGGGPARSLEALLEKLGSEFSFFIVASAYEPSSARIMRAVDPDTWRPFGQGNVWYATTRSRNIGTLLRNVDPDVVYLNSLFDVRFSGIPLMYFRIARTGVPVLLAPRGELSPGALRLKRPRKRAFLLIFRLLRLHRYVEWQASSDLEGSHIRERFGKRVTVHLAPPLSSHEPEESHDSQGKCRTANC